MTAKWLIALISVLCSAPALVGDEVLFVDDDAPAKGDGQTWDTAYRFLQDALAYASEPANGVTEIRVAQGIYKPDRDEANPDGTLDRDATFDLVTAVALIGGYAGLGAEDPDERDIDLYETILSGDLLGNDDFDAFPIGATFVENAYHVAIANDLDPTTIHDGITFESGNATGNDFESSGAGMLMQSSSPTMIRCTFRHNQAISDGGGMYAFAGNPRLEGCVFHRNSAGNVAGGLLLYESSATVVDCAFTENATPGPALGAPGGAGAVAFDSNATFADCAFTNNLASNGRTNGVGGGIVNIGKPSPRLIRCTFRNNFAFRGGGAIQNQNSQAPLTECMFIGNAAGLGGAITNLVSSDVVVTNCTFVANTADTGESVFHYEGTTLALFNCIVWGAGIPFAGDGVLTAMFSDIEGGWAGEGNIDRDPLFVDSDNDDYHLGSGSPCIDAADNNAVPPDEFDLDGDGDTDEALPYDLDGNPRFVDDPGTKDTGVGRPPIVDMGAYEFQGVACPWDLNGDDLVGTGDLILLLGSWGDPYGTADLIELLGNWGPCPK